MCENKLFSKKEDGLCIMCHMALCQQEACECPRCTDACEKIIKWMKEDENREEE